METHDHGVEKRRGFELCQGERMICPCRKQRQERELCSAVAIPKGMYGVQFREKVRCSRRENVGCAPAQERLIFQPAEQSAHFRRDILGIAEGAIALNNPNGPEATSPAINVLKEMPMDGPVVRNAQAPARQRLISPLRCTGRLKALESGSFTKAGNVFENRTAGIAVGVSQSVVERLGQAEPFPYLPAMARRRLPAESPR